MPFHSPKQLLSHTLARLLTLLEPPLSLLDANLTLSARLITPLALHRIPLARVITLLLRLLLFLTHRLKQLACLGGILGLFPKHLLEVLQRTEK